MTRRVHDQITERLAVTVHTSLNQKHKAFTLYIKIRGNVVVHWNCSVLLSCYVSSELLSSFTPRLAHLQAAMHCSARRSGQEEQATRQSTDDSASSPRSFENCPLTSGRSVGQSAEPPTVAGQTQFPAIRCPCPAYPRPRQSWRGRGGESGETRDCVARTISWNVAQRASWRGV